MAEKLTKAQRDLVLRADKPMPAFMYRDDHDGRAAWGDLRRTGLFASKMGGAQCLHWSLTDAGLAVKAHLQRTQGEG